MVNPNDVFVLRYGMRDVCRLNINYNITVYSTDFSSLARLVEKICWDDITDKFSDTLVQVYNERSGTSMMSTLPLVDETSL